MGGDEAHKNAQKMKPVCPDFCSSYASVQYWSGSAYNEENATSLKKTISTNDCERFSLKKKKEIHYTNFLPFGYLVVSSQLRAGSQIDRT